LGWECSSDEVTLAQLEQMPGNVAHPTTFDFPVIYRRVPGACFRTVVLEPNEVVLASNIAAAQDLEQEGVALVMTNCGFNALYQRELAAAVNVPVVASSLLQVPLVQRTLRPGQRVCVLTADREHLTRQHLQGAGIVPDPPLIIVGVEGTEQFARVRQDPAAELNPACFVEEIVEVSRAQLAAQPEIGAYVLECTDLPPAAAALRRATGLPVFDIVTLAQMVYEALTGDRWGDPS
jgi:hypothetical protein